MSTDANHISTKSINVEILHQSGDINTEQGISVGKFYIVHRLRTPSQLFKASAAVTAGVMFALGVGVVAAKLIEYTATFF